MDCGRIPIVFSLSPPSSEDRFRIRAIPYNPEVYCGEGIGAVPLWTALGLEQRLGTTVTPPLHGLELSAHNTAGLIAAAELIAPDGEGADQLATPGFESHVVPATEPGHTARDVRATGQLEGCVVRCGGIEMDCIKHDGDRVRLRKPDGKTVWRTVGDLEVT